jgi:hypothetical protein
MLHADSLPRALILSAKDNVATVLNGATRGTVLAYEGGTITCACDLPAGHKVSLVPIARGSNIIKFGVPIGSATRDIAAGEHVHVQNLASDYTPTWVAGQ